MSTFSPPPPNITAPTPGSLAVPVFLYLGTFIDTNNADLNEISRKEMPLIEKICFKRIFQENYFVPAHFPFGIKKTQVNSCGITPLVRLFSL